MRRFRLLAFVVLLLSAVGASAQGNPSASKDPNPDPHSAPALRVADGRPTRRQNQPLAPNAGWGNQPGAIYIAATQFTGKFNAASPDLDHVANQFYSGSGEYFAQITVDPGNAISHFTCHFTDSHATDNVQLRWLRYRTDFDSGNTSGVVMDAFVTSGTPGVSYDFLNPSGVETMQVYDALEDDLINHYLSVVLTPNVSFAGCYAFSWRQVSPAPAVATFSDVPTSHPFFRFVEALVSTGVTAGCGGGLYCVNSSVTRGELAVFLAVALGMGIPY